MCCGEGHRAYIAVSGRSINLNCVWRWDNSKPHFFKTSVDNIVVGGGRSDGPLVWFSSFTIDIDGWDTGKWLES